MHHHDLRLLLGYLIEVELGVNDVGLAIETVIDPGIGDRREGHAGTGIEVHRAGRGADELAAWHGPVPEDEVHGPALEALILLDVGEDPEGGAVEEFKAVDHLPLDPGGAGDEGIPGHD